MHLCVRVQVSSSLLRRYKFKKLECDNLIEKVLVNNNILKNREKYIVNERDLNSKISRIRNACIFTNRKRGLIKKYKISRMLFKKQSSKGYLYGLKKRS